MDFRLNTIFDFNNGVRKSYLIKFKPINPVTMNTENNNNAIILNREHNHLSIHDSYLEIEFVLSDNTVGVFGNDANIGLVNYGILALFSSVNLETSGDKNY